MSAIDQEKSKSVFTLSENVSNNIEIQQNKTIFDKPADYERAIAATRFGKFNYILYLACMPAAIAMIFSNSSISYILSQAQCDLDLSLENKGMLNAMPYFGMISSGLIWGTVADKYGRRTVFIYAFLLEAIFNFLAAHSRTYWMLLTAKYFSGFMICGPVAVLMTYISEFHQSKYRPKIVTILGVYWSIAKILLPLIAWALMPQQFHFIIVDRILEYKSWQLFLIVCCLPAVLACMVHYIMPETPKFLLSQGRYDEALKLFQIIYEKNTKNFAHSYPYTNVTDIAFEEKKLTVDEQSANKSITEKIIEMLKDMKPLLASPYVYKMIPYAGIQFGSLLGVLSLRLWLPQLFAKMDEYQQIYDNVDATLCEMLDYSPKQKNITFNNSSEICTVPNSTSEVYINNMIVPIIAIIGYFLIAIIINKIGKKIILLVTSALMGIAVFSNYWSKNSFTTVILSSLFLAGASITSTVSSSIAVEMFPTNLRAKAMSIALIVGRFGPIIGNIVFPYLLYTGCLAPFLFIAGFSFLCTLLGLFLPGTENKPLK